MNLKARNAIHVLVWTHRCCSVCVCVLCWLQSYLIGDVFNEKKNPLAMKPLDLLHILSYFASSSLKSIIFLVRAYIIQSIIHHFCLAGSVLNCICALTYLPLLLCPALPIMSHHAPPQLGYWTIYSRVCGPYVVNHFHCDNPYLHGICQGL